MNLLKIGLFDVLNAGITDLSYFLYRAPRRSDWRCFAALKARHRTARGSGRFASCTPGRVRIGYKPCKGGTGSLCRSFRALLLLPCYPGLRAALGPFTLGFDAPRRWRSHSTESFIPASRFATSLRV